MAIMELAHSLFGADDVYHLAFLKTMVLFTGRRVAQVNLFAETLGFGFSIIAWQEKVSAHHLFTHGLGGCLSYAR